MAAHAPRQHVLRRGSNATITPGAAGAGAPPWAASAAPQHQQQRHQQHPSSLPLAANRGPCPRDPPRGGTRTGARPLRPGGKPGPLSKGLTPGRHTRRAFALVANWGPCPRDSPQEGNLRPSLPLRQTGAPGQGTHPGKMHLRPGGKPGPLTEGLTPGRCKGRRNDGRGGSGSVATTRHSPVSWTTCEAHLSAPTAATAASADSLPSHPFQWPVADPQTALARP